MLRAKKLSVSIVLTIFLTRLAPRVPPFNTGDADNGVLFNIVNLWSTE